MSTSLTGGCLCGAVRYESSVPPVMTGNCHCRDCQRASGSAYAPTLFAPSAAVTITGEVKYFTNKGSSGRAVSRGFCPGCGSQLFGTVEQMPGLLAIRAGTLDDPSLFQPAIDLFTSRAPAWDFMDPKLPKFPEMPPRD
ncbi:MAG: GFA family protein [Candidatus Accumulibacter sp.]|uniref:GFA family protein n=1 Tax=Accumulibacter sp. TaxID=2053492 RepID=UPI001A63B22A|nr:GFA family protein [Accumulibacter sp.]MBL8393466.1 GFA family protein [Accumulibacter sp.]